MSSRLNYVALRSVQTLVLIALIVTFLFFFFRLMPGSYTDLMMFRGASPETIEKFNERWGLNDPLSVQFFRYAGNMLTGDAGISIQYRVPVFEYVKKKIFNSSILVAPAITAAYIVGSVLGSVLGSNRGSRIEKYGLAPIILLGAFPSFFTGILLIIVFAGWLNLFPTSGMFGTANAYIGSEYPWWRPYITKDFGVHYVLPFTAIFMRYLYLPSLIMRTSVVEVSNQDFLYYHRMTGLPAINQLKHLMKNASLPVITLYPVSMTRAIGGLVVLEIVFNWPGIGFTLVHAVLSRDFPVVQFVFFLVAAFVVIANFFVDIAYGIIDPRVSVEGDDS